MIFEETQLHGAYLITLQPMVDERGFFARTFCKNEFEQHGLHNNFVQANISYNQKKGTLRGLHYQEYPHGEVKIVTCHRGAIFDVIVDIRKNSPTYGQWISVELTADNYRALYIPEGFAHGFQTLCDDVEVFYQMGNYYVASAANGIRWNDPTLGITWPSQNSIISERDKNFPGFQ